MTNLQKAWAYFKTINKHRAIVGHWCFMMGIPWRGLVHDLSKYTWKEFSIYKYYTGTKSPHAIAREQLGYSPSWLYHKARNKHHWEFWLDNETKNFVPIKIPYKYVIEMFCDFVGAGKVYQKDTWTCSLPLEYHNKCKEERLFQSETLKLFELLLHRLSDLDIKQFLKWYKYSKHNLKISYNNGGFKGDKI